MRVAYIAHSAQGFGEAVTMHRIQSIKRQRGATFLGILTIVSILGLAVYAGIRLAPLYKEYMDVSTALTQTAKEMSVTSTPGEIRKSLERRWIIEDIKTIQPKDIDVVKLGSTMTLRAQYRAEAAFIANVSLVVDFDKSVRVGSPDIP